MDKKAISLIVSAMFAIPLAAWSQDDAAPTAVAKGGSSLQILAAHTSSIRSAATVASSAALLAHPPASS